MENKKQYSTNKLAENIVGKRDVKKGTVFFDQPFELDYHCPVCNKHHGANPEVKGAQRVSTLGEFDERITWSEYNGFIYCYKCDKDYPSALCQPNIDKAIETYLHCVLEAQRLKGYNLKDKKQVPVDLDFIKWKDTHFSIEHNEETEAKYFHYQEFNNEKSPYYFNHYTLTEVYQFYKKLNNG